MLVHGAHAGPLDDGNKVAGRQDIRQDREFGCNPRVKTLLPAMGTTAVSRSLMVAPGPAGDVYGGHQRYPRLW
jgi:hypothetical protein